MIFADKLIQLRKKAGWSQEELAQQMSVSRQSVSKWEGAQSVPDLEKILHLSELFGVSTDYLLKDEIVETEYVDLDQSTSVIRRVTLEDANAFLTVKATTSRWVAYGALLCILSPICLFILGVMSELPRFGFPEGMALGVGMVVLVVLVIVAVGMFIYSGSKSAPFDYLEKEVFETEYGVSGMVKERKEHFKSRHTRDNIIGACLCIMFPVPLFVGFIIGEENDLLMVLLLSVSFILVGIGVTFFIRSGIIWASFEKLLQEGDYAKEKKRNYSVKNAVFSAYWLIVTAIFLGYSFTTHNWQLSWIIWAIAGVVFPAVVGIVNVIEKRD